MLAQPAKELGELRRPPGPGDLGEGGGPRERGVLHRSRRGEVLAPALELGPEHVAGLLLPELGGHRLVGVDLAKVFSPWMASGSSEPVAW